MARSTSSFDGVCAASTGASKNNILVSRNRVSAAIAPASHHTIVAPAGGSRLCAPIMGMSPEEFRQHGHHIVDWIADYLAHPERYPVLPKVDPGAITDALPSAGPEQGQPMESILKDFEARIVPAITHWNNPGFMAYFASTAT